jgi:hypothetical protein
MMIKPKLWLAILITVGAFGCVHRIPPPIDNRLPKWVDSMSDGCSAFSLLPNGEALNRTLGVFNKKETAACVIHDHAYYRGGSEKDRLEADQQLKAAFESAGSGGPFNLIDKLWQQFKAKVVFDLVREWGGPEHKIRRVSWAFGPISSPTFAYTDKPKAEREY